MTSNLWFDNGMEAIRENRWFDGYQMLYGALVRATRIKDSETIHKIIINSIPLFVTGKQTDLACNIALSFISNFPKINKSESEWLSLIHILFDYLHQNQLENCLVEVRRTIITNKKFSHTDFIIDLTVPTEALTKSPEIQYDIFYCQAGLFATQKDYVGCFNSLEKLSLKINLIPKIRVYLTLSELNAYEIDGCGKYIKEMHDKLTPEDELYLEIATRVFKAVETSHKKDFLSLIKEYDDIINIKVDPLLKLLCDGISEIFQNSNRGGLLSSFFKG